MNDARVNELLKQYPNKKALKEYIKSSGNKPQWFVWALLACVKEFTCITDQWDICEQAININCGSNTCPWRTSKGEISHIRAHHNEVEVFNRMKVRELFAVVDEDRNGVISFDEYFKYCAKKREVYAEQKGKLRKEFDAMDKNGDGVLTQEEVIQFCLAQKVKPQSSKIAVADVKARE